VKIVHKRLKLQMDIAENVIINLLNKYYKKEVNKKDANIVAVIHLIKITIY